MRKIFSGNLLGKKKSYDKRMAFKGKRGGDFFVFLIHLVNHGDADQSGVS